MPRRPIYPALLVAFPLGLIVLGILTFGYYLLTLDNRTQEEIEADERARRAEVVSMLRKDPQVADLQTYVRLLTALGPRNAAHPKALTQTADSIDNFLGGFNMGYQVNRQGFVGEDGVQRTNVYVEVAGRSAETLLIVADASSPGDSPGADANASGVAVLLTLANAFIGTKPENTIRFLALADAEGAEAHAQAAFESGETLGPVLVLDRLGSYASAPGTQRAPDGLDASIFPAQGDFVAVIGDLAGIGLVESVENLLSLSGTLPVHGEAVSAQVPILADSALAPFLRTNGVRGVLVTATGELRSASAGTRDDTLEQLEMEPLHAVALGLQKVVQALANPEPAP